MIEPHRLQVEVLIEQLRITIKALKRFDDEIAATANKLPDYNLLFSPLPGAAHSPGTATCWQRSVKTGNAIRRPMPCRMYSGIAPVTKRSGQNNLGALALAVSELSFVRPLLTGPHKRLINRHGRVPIYRQQRAKGCSYQVAVRALAFKWIRVLHRCWQDRTPYDESKYLEALRRKGFTAVKISRRIRLNTLTDRLRA